jgi:hypothetical protein
METIHVFRQQMSSRELQTLKQLVLYVLNRKTIMLKSHFYSSFQIAVLTSALDTAAVFPNSALVLICFNKGLQQEFDLIRLVLQPSLILLQHISNI